MILRTSRRACNITENLLRFSRPPAREARETDLAGLVADALDLIGPETRKHSIEIDFTREEIQTIRKSASPPARPALTATWTARSMPC